MTGTPSFSGLSSTAMVLAAGFGTRMRPLTLDKPKPLLEIGGRTMLDLAIDKLVQIGIARVVVNAHYLGDQIAAHSARRSDVEMILSAEDEILDTGGGIKNARAAFGDQPFFVLGGDMPFVDGPSGSALARLAAAWDPDRMDILMLCHPREKARGFGPNGDFMRRADGALWRKDAPVPRDYVWLSAQIVKPQLYDAVTDTVFSNNLLFDRAEAEGRLFGIVHDGTCFHVGTPEDLREANALWTSGKGWG